MTVLFGVCQRCKHTDKACVHIMLTSQIRCREHNGSLGLVFRAVGLSQASRLAAASPYDQSIYRPHLLVLHCVRALSSQIPSLSHSQSE